MTNAHGAVVIECDTALCCNVGAVYTWGQNQDGQLGLGDCQGRATPTLIEDAALETQNVTQVAFRISSAVLKDFPQNACCTCTLSCFGRCHSIMCLPLKTWHAENPIHGNCLRKQGFMRYGGMRARDVVAGLLRSQTLRSPHRQPPGLHLGLEQVPPARSRQCE